MFNPLTERTDGLPRLLILDGHPSHDNPSFLAAANKMQIWIRFLPSHTSYMLQPLDVGCFGPVESYYRQQIAKFIRQNGPHRVRKQIFCDIYERVRNQGLCSRNIRGGWRGTGLVPWNPDRVLATINYREKTPPIERPDEGSTVQHTPRSMKQIEIGYRQVMADTKANGAGSFALTKLRKATRLLFSENCLLKDTVEQLKDKENDKGSAIKRAKFAMDPNQRIVDPDMMDQMFAERHDIRAKTGPAKRKNTAVDSGSSSKKAKRSKIVVLKYRGSSIVQ